MKMRDKQLTQRLNDWFKGVLILSLLISAACSIDEKNETTNVNSDIGNNLSDKSEELTILGVVAEIEQEDNPASNAIDSNLTSRWSGFGTSVDLTLDLGEVKNIDYVEIAFYKGDERTTAFDVYTSNDNANWSLINSKTSSGLTTTSQLFDLENTEAQFLRFEFLGNSNNAWNSVTDLTVFGTTNDSVLSYTTIPATIQAEDYTDKSESPRTEPSQDIDNGISVGWITNANDFLSYNVNVPNSGEYTMDFRVASKTNGIKFDIYQGSEIIGNISSPATGAWYTWETVSTTVKLTAGEQTIKLVATGSGWNVNWLNIDKQTVDPNAINLNLRVHLMQGSPWVHASGVEMNSWVTPNDVTQVILPELNAIWSPSNIVWNVESIIEESLYEFNGYQDSVNFVINTERDSSGSSDPERLPHLYDLMQPGNKSANDELGTNLFHIYLFPFIGNTSQGNAMSGFGYHSVVGTWSNKHNGGGDPERTLLTEDQDRFIRGSLSRTIGHELGHVLGLTHSQCSDCLMQGAGYSLTDEQIEIAEDRANARL